MKGPLAASLGGEDALAGVLYGGRALLIILPLVSPTL